MLLFLCLFLRLTFSLYDRFAYMTFDLGIYDQATWLISQGQVPFVTARGVHLLGDHFSLILYLIAPLYGLFPTPKTLLALQAIALALGAIPAYGLARKRLGSEPLALLFGLIYLVHPAHQWSITYEFHPEVFATPLLVTAFYAIEARRWPLLAASLALTALTKESAGLTIVCVGVWALSKNRRAGLAAIAFGLLMLPVSMLAVRYFNGGQSSPYFAIFRHYGSTPVEMMHNFVSHPIPFVGDLFQPVNIQLVAALMLVFCFLPLLAPDIMLLSLPMLIVNFMGGRSGMHTYEEYYFAYSTPFFYLGAIKGLQRAQQWDWFPRRLMRVNLPVWAVSGIVMGPLVRPVNTIYSGMPPTEARDECSNAISLIPPGSSVSAAMALGPHVNHRTRLYLFPNPFVRCAYGGTQEALQQIDSVNQTTLPHDLLGAIEAGSPKADYVLLCPKSSPFPLSDANQALLTAALLRSRKYEAIYVGRSVMALKRLPPGGKPSLRLLAQRTAKPTDTPEQTESAYWRWVAAQYPPKGATP